MKTINYLKVMALLLCIVSFVGTTVFGQVDWTCKILAEHVPGSPVKTFTENSVTSFNFQNGFEATVRAMFKMRVGWSVKFDEMDVIRQQEEVFIRMDNSTEISLKLSDNISITYYVSGMNVCDNFGVKVPKATVKKIISAIEKADKALSSKAFIVGHYEGPLYRIDYCKGDIGLPKEAMIITPGLKSNPEVLNYSGSGFLVEAEHLGDKNYELYIVGIDRVGITGLIQEVVLKVVGNCQYSTGPFDPMQIPVDGITLVTSPKIAVTFYSANGQKKVVDFARLAEKCY